MGNKTWAANVRDLVDGGYELLSGTDADRLYGDISSQLSHLGLRPAKDEDKIRPNSDDMKLLEDEIARFRQHLRVQFVPAPSQRANSSDLVGKSFDRSGCRIQTAMYLWCEIPQCGFLSGAA